VPCHRACGKELPRVACQGEEETADPHRPSILHLQTAQRERDSHSSGRSSCFLSEGEAQYGRVIVMAA
jgi:hypothetical protein